MLYQFGRANIGHNDGGIEWRVDFLQCLHRTLGAHAHHDPVRVHEIVHGKTFTQKLRVAGDVELDLCFAIAFDRFRHVFPGLHGHGAFCPR